MAGGAKVQVGHGDHAARSARVPGPRRQRRVRRRVVQPRGQRQQLGGRALRAQQPVRERVPGQRRLQPVNVASTSASTTHQAVHRRQRRDGLRDAQEETSPATAPEVREDAAHHHRVITAAATSSYFHTSSVVYYLFILYTR